VVKKEFPDEIPELAHTLLYILSYDERFKYKKITEVIISLVIGVFVI
jgi:hypothetical protein